MLSNSKERRQGRRHIGRHLLLCFEIRDNGGGNDDDADSGCCRLWLLQQQCRIIQRTVPKTKYQVQLKTFLFWLSLFSGRIMIGKYDIANTNIRRSNELYTTTCDGAMIAVIVMMMIVFSIIFPVAKGRFGRRGSKGR